jgi:hypothetical protein
VAGDGTLRCLAVEGDVVRYRPGLEPQARLTFIDGGMMHTTPERYQLLDLDAFTPLRTG